MRPNDLLLRCFVVRDKDQWVAMCVDLSLAAQGDSMAEAKSKLHAQVQEYVYDAMVGVDKDDAGYLMKRRAPLSVMVYYWWVVFKVRLNRHRNKSLQARAFSEPLPMQPVGC